jgi:hypothetical protein
MVGEGPGNASAGLRPVLLGHHCDLASSLLHAGISSGIPTFHSLAVACAFGPLGLLLHAITKVRRSQMGCHTLRS